MKRLQSSLARHVPVDTRLTDDELRRWARDLWFMRDGDKGVLVLRLEWIWPLVDRAAAEAIGNRVHGDAHGKRA